jgi:glycine cleavage system H protein
VSERHVLDPYPPRLDTLSTPSLPALPEPTMSDIPGDLKFLKSHEWARVEGDGKVTVGISDHAQGLLGDLVYVELPNVGDRVEAGNACAVVESVKAASDVYAPISGTVVEVNSALADKPETINEDAYGDGWIFVVEAEEPDQLNELLGPDDYAELLEDDDH